MVPNHDGSDRDAVGILLHTGRQENVPKTTVATSPRVLKSGGITQHLSLLTEMTCEWLQHVSGQITRTKNKEKGYKESAAIREMREKAKGETEPRQATEMWKMVWKMRRKEKRDFDKMLADKAVKQDWWALQQIRAAPRRQCQTNLISHEDWKEQARSHFEGNFLPETMWGSGRRIWIIFVFALPLCASARQYAWLPRMSWSQWHRPGSGGRA